jgi:serine protease Do
MTLTPLFSIADALPDVFSSALMQLVETVQPSIVQVRNGGRGAGTGIIWHEDGRIITNHHVIAGNKSKVHVQLPDGRALEAQVVDSDSMLDLALLQVTADKLVALPIGDSARLRVGELVFAIGNPWGRRGVVTAGIVSGLGTVHFQRSDRTAQYIKSDVRLAPGNSGGPLLDAQGTVVGVNAMIFGGDLSVAIPSNVVTEWIADLEKRKETKEEERALERSA